MASSDIQKGVQDTPPGWLEPTVHTVYLRLLARSGEAPAEMQLGRSNAAKLHTYLETSNTLQRLGYPLTADQGMAFGLAVPVVAHGFMGLAAIAAPNLRGTLEILARYTTIRSDLYRSTFKTNAELGVLRFAPRFDLGVIAPFVQATTLFSFMQLFAFLLAPDELRQLRLELPWRIGNSDLLKGAFGIASPLYQRGSAVSLALPAALLAKENISSDYRQYGIAVRACEEELAELQGAMSARVKRVLEQREWGKWPQLVEVARGLGVSRRTLIRKLAEQGTSYGELLSQTRCDLSCWYLLNTRLPIDAIAEKVGYSDGSNFSRTFSAWMGMTPRVYRQEHCR